MTEKTFVHAALTLATLAISRARAADVIRDAALSEGGGVDDTGVILADHIGSAIADISPDGASLGIGDAGLDGGVADTAVGVEVALIDGSARVEALGILAACGRVASFDHGSLISAVIKPVDAISNAAAFSLRVGGLATDILAETLLALLVSATSLDSCGLVSAVIEPEAFIADAAAFGLGIGDLAGGFFTSALFADLRGIAAFDAGDLEAAIIKPEGFIANATAFGLGVRGLTSGIDASALEALFWGLAGFDESGLVSAVIKPIEVAANAALFFLGVGDGTAAFYALGVVAFAAFVGLAALCLRPTETAEGIDLTGLHASLIAAFSTAATGVCAGRRKITRRLTLSGRTDLPTRAIIRNKGFTARRWEDATDQDSRLIAFTALLSHRTSAAIARGCAFTRRQSSDDHPQPKQTHPHAPPCNLCFLLLFFAHTHHPMHPRTNL